jgi:hypothetical protein
MSDLDVPENIYDSLRKGLRKARSPASKPLTRAEVERMIDERLQRHMRELRLTFIQQRRNGCCG